MFTIGRTAVEAGMPHELLGAPFLCEPGRDRGLANEFLGAIKTGEFARLRRDQRPDWMSAGRKFRATADSQHQNAQALNTALRWLDSKKIRIERLTEEHLESLATGLEMRGLKNGPIAAIQTALLHFAQWCVWKGRRPPLSVSFNKFQRPRSTSWAPATGINIFVIRKQAATRPNYLTEAEAKAICAGVRDLAKRIAVKLIFLSGLRPFEPGKVRDDAVPPASTIRQSVPALFPVRGKGAKERQAELRRELALEIDEYRIAVRPIRAAKYMRIFGQSDPPIALLLNGKDGRPLSYVCVYRAFTRVARKLGIRGTPHWGRHFYAADFLAEGMIELIRRFELAGIPAGPDDHQASREIRIYRLQRNMGHSDRNQSLEYADQADRAFDEKLVALRTGEDVR